mgnify:CR=1 FL=1
MNKEKILSFLGLVKRAKKLETNPSTVIDLLKNNKVHLVFIDESYNTDSARQIRNKCAFYNIQIISTIEKDELSHSIGEKNTNVIAILDKGFKDAILKLL